MIVQRELCDYIQLLIPKHLAYKCYFRHQSPSYTTNIIVFDHSRIQMNCRIGERNIIIVLDHVNLWIADHLFERPGTWQGLNEFDKKYNKQDILEYIANIVYNLHCIMIVWYPSSHQIRQLRKKLKQSLWTN